MSSAHTTFNKHVFPFFRLPQELRDNIYDSCDDFQPDHDGFQFYISKLQEFIHVSLKGGYMTNLLLINKQFATEYKNRKERHRTLVITKSVFILDGVFEYKRASHLPLLSQYVAGVEFNTACNTGSVARSIEKDWKWLQSVLKKMPKIRSDQVGVNVHMNESSVGHPPGNLRKMWTQNGEDALTSLTSSGVSLVRVYSFFDESYERICPSEVVWQEIGSWSRARGWMASVESLNTS